MTETATGPLAASVAITDQVAVLQSGGMVLATVAQLVAIPMAALDALTARVAAAESAVAALQAKPSPNVVLTGTLPVTTLQVGSIDIPVAVPGLLRADTVSIEIEADLPAGVDLRAMHPARDRDGVLIVQVTASLAAVTAAVPIRVVAER